MKKIALIAMSYIMLTACSGQKTIEDITYKTNTNNYSVEVTAFDIYSEHSKDQTNGINVESLDYITQTKNTKEQIVRKVVKNIKDGDKIAFRGYSSNVSQVGGVIEVKNTISTPYISSYEVFYIDNVRKEEMKFSEVVQGSTLKFELKENNSANKSPYLFYYKINSDLLEKIDKKQKIELPYVYSKAVENSISLKNEQTILIKYVKNIENPENKKSKYKNIETYFLISVKVN